MKFLSEKINLRIYQQTILDSAIKQNVLCVIPTGLGKTLIAIALSGILCKTNEDKILFLAPTKPLVNQHKNSYSELFKASKEDIVAVTGTTKTNKREEIWEDAQIIISTPQTVKHDIIANRIDLKKFKLIVFDEAHRTIGDYAYTSIAKYYNKLNPSGKILALTASPGSDEEKINQICENLFIEKIELRSKDHHEVASFIKPLITHYEFIDLPEEFLKIKKYLELSIKDRLLILKQLGFVTTTDPKRLSKKELLLLQNRLRARIREGDFDVMRGISVVAAIIKINHAITLLDSESISALCYYLDNIWEKGKTTNVKAVKNMITDFNIRIAYKLAKEAKENKLEHPKLKYLKKVFEKVVSKKKDAKILVFTEFRSNINQILETLSDFAVEKFIGQASTVGKGMSQKEQIEKIQMLKNSEINGLICTSVAEEGLDIPAVDFVIFYSPVPSAIRSIQRRGRTGRQSLGNLIILIAKKTRDEAYYWVAKRREQNMGTAIKKVSTTLQKPLIQQNLIQKQTELEVTKIEPNEDVVIYVDNRERGYLVEELHDLGAKIHLKNLEVGDFILSDDVVAEKKEVNDFVASLLDRRLFTQAIEMKRNFDKPIFILEGEYDKLFESRNVDPNAIRSAIISLTLDYGIPFIFSSSPKETAEYLYRIAFREQVKLRKDVSLRGSRRDWPIELQQQFLLEGLPLVGKNLAINLLKEFKNPKGVANASIDDLQKVDKVGKKKAEIIRSVFDEEFKSD
jgi:ERCC4-related helicase